MSEPTSALTFGDLILEVAREIGIAYNGPAGDQDAQIPVDSHDLSECKRHVNNAIRMFIADAPAPNGWRWLRPVADVVIWPAVGVDSANKVISQGYVAQTGKTQLQAASDSFYETMENKEIVVTGVGTFTVTDYVSARVIKVQGDATGAGVAGVTWSLASDGTFTLPRGFSGQYAGVITYTSATNLGAGIDWVNESDIRRWKESGDNQTGTPLWAAIRVMGSGTPRRRWELVTWPTPQSVETVQFPFTLHFDKLLDFDEYPPTPVAHDEAIKAACLAVVERDVEKVKGPLWDYYDRTAKPNSWQIDNRSAPKKLGYVGDGPCRTPGPTPIHGWLNRPNVTFNQ